ncbi:chemotaxis-specific protein-glutamate methyltransferase CheB [uncultured Enterovirga sp.]|uniref:chemotaxis-specific protein-glutamate methyltransferase CheB n=1 Tax=uncultured Enterovirga sp. TaxID=2026352 RepID=UPI0035C9F43D
MIVDDSAVVRGLVARWISEEPGFSVVGVAANGRIALDTLEEAQPDVVLLDLDMPVLDGMATLPLLLRARPGMSVVIVSTLTQRNAEISLRCLSVGAVDYLAKPSGSKKLTVSATFRTELMAKLEGLAGRCRRPDGLGSPVPSGTAEFVALRDRSPSRAQVILIAASTGGPRAVIEVLRGLSGPRVPILVVQHMPPIFTAVFAGHIAAETGLAAAEARDGEPVEPGRVYVAPGGRHMGLARTASGAPAIRLDDGPAVSHCRPAVDILMRDAAEIYGAGALAAILTGMGSDGLEGARAFAAVGGTVVVQDEASSVVWGMPGSIARARLARSVLPLEGIAAALEARLGPAAAPALPLSRAVA